MVLCSNNLVADMYARTLIELDESEEVFSSLKSLRCVLCEKSFLLKFLKAPIASRRQKVLFVRILTTKISVPSIVEKFLIVLCYEGRISLLREIINFYEKRIWEKRGIYKGVITTAKPLSQEIQEQLENKFANVRFSYKVRPEIIGGSIIETNGYVVDASFKERLKKLAWHMKG